MPPLKTETLAIEITFPFPCAEMTPLLTILPAKSGAFSNSMAVTVPVRARISPPPATVMPPEIIPALSRILPPEIKPPLATMMPFGLIVPKLVTPPSLTTPLIATPVVLVPLLKVRGNGPV